MYSIKPQSPIVNWGHALAKPLVFDAQMFPGGLKVVDNYSQKMGTVLGSTAVINARKRGSAIVIGSNGDAIDFTTIAKQTNIALLSIEALVAISSTAANGARLFNKYDEATIVWLGIENQTAAGVNRLGFRYRWSGGLAEWATADGSMTGKYDIPVHIVITYDTGATTNVPNFYIDGVLQTGIQTITAASGTIQADGDDLGIGSRPTPNTQVTSMIGDIYYARMYERILSHQNVRSLYANPWQIYQRPD